ncbi:carbon storage regulator [Sedimentibacter acidaminivorans]|uniref:Translational regulator CsrA n=1 Tax=Sedimentibacter acidaminivorans TaxID=913099 RepID=A0ABS4GDK5_9FIRM|nr:carbon storage regulator [Sedimentibacter acidaminivorans]MBP1925759.1 carbon storage regulator [Sedimentibacter acidaminivorans]
MLVIKRKETESILIGDDIEIIVSEISLGKVKICINAPKDVKIYRKELIETSDFNKTASEKINQDSIKNLNIKLRNHKINL